MVQEIALKGKYEFSDLIGWSGLEQEYESTLRGKKGVTYYQVDAYGRETGKLDGQDGILAYPGDNISTTLDVSLQELLENELKGKRGVGIVSSPKTGGILAYVSSPDYTPDLFTGLVSNMDWESIIADTNRPLLNRVANGTYPPGSIFKMVVAIALLEEKLITPQLEISCSGSYDFYERTFHCWNEYGHGKINLEQAIVQSCDVYFYNVIQKINLNDLAEYAKRFGFGLVTNIDLPSEMKGRMPNRQFMNKIHGRWGWSLGALLNISIGQGEILVTPLQMVSYINVLATRGKTRPLHLVKSRNIEIQKQNISQQTWDVIQLSMHKVVTDSKGTGWRSDPRISGLKISGKTSTAENPHGDPHAWYIAYGEKDDEMISVVVMVENSGNGSEVSAPIAKKVFHHYFNSVKSKLANF